MYSLVHTEFNAHDESILACSIGHITSSIDILEDLANSEYEGNSTSKTEECIVTGSLDNTVKVWLMQDNSLSLYRNIKTSSLGIVSIAINDDCTVCAITSIDSNLMFWNLLSNELINEVSLGPVEIWCATFTSDCKHVIAGGHSGKMAMLTVPSGIQEQLFDTSGKFILSVACSSDGKYVASGAIDGIIHIFDIQTAKLTHTFEGHALPVRSLCFSPDSERLLTGSDDGHMKLYSLKQSKSLALISGHTSWILDVTFSADSKYFLSSSSDKVVKLWKADDLKCAQIFKDHTDQVWCSKFNGNRKKIITVSEDKSINIYKCNS